MELGIDLLGRFGVYRGGREVTSGEFGGRLTGRLVRLLVTRRGEVVTREALIEALWGDRAPADPDANLNVLVNRARRGLGDSGLIATVPGGYVFPSAAAVRIDVERFEVLVRQTRQRRDRGDQPWVLAGAEEGGVRRPGPGGTRGRGSFVGPVRRPRPGTRPYVRARARLPGRAGGGAIRVRQVAAAGRAGRPCRPLCPARTRPPARTGGPLVAGAQAAGRRGRHRRRHHRAAAAPLRRGTGAAVAGTRPVDPCAHLRAGPANMAGAGPGGGRCWRRPGTRSS